MRSLFIQTGQIWWFIENSSPVLFAVLKDGWRYRAMVGPPPDAVLTISPHGKQRPCELLPLRGIVIFIDLQDGVNPRAYKVKDRPLSPLRPPNLSGVNAWTGHLQLGHWRPDRPWPSTPQSHPAEF